MSLLGIFRKEHFVSSGKDTAQALKKNSKEKTDHERTESKAESLVKIVTGFVYPFLVPGSWQVLEYENIKTLMKGTNFNEE